MNWTVLLLGIFTVILSTLGAAYLKKAAMKRLPNTNLFMAGTFYAGSVLPFVTMLNKTDLSFAYPFTALHYILASIIGVKAFNEKMTAKKAAGITLVGIGIVLIAIGKI